MRRKFLLFCYFFVLNFIAYFIYHQELHKMQLYDLGAKAIVFSQFVNMLDVRSNIFLLIFQSVCVWVCVCVCVHVCALSIYLSIHLSIYLSIYISIYLFACPSVRLLYWRRLTQSDSTSSSDTSYFTPFDYFLFDNTFWIVNSCQKLNISSAVAGIPFTAGRHTVFETPRPHEYRSEGCGEFINAIQVLLGCWTYLPEKRREEGGEEEKFCV